MNNQNSQGQSQNWRGHSYMQESRNHNIPRSENFYSHYPSPQFVGDYMHPGYVYPSILPSYRSAESSIPPPNSQCVNPLAMITPEDYSKYYNKIQNYMPQDPRASIKNYPSHHNFYEHPHPYRNPLHYPGLGISGQNIPQGIHHGSFPANHLFRNDKMNKNKSVIVIESDQENIHHGNQNKKVLKEKKEQKLAAIDQKNNQQKFQDNQILQEEKKQQNLKLHPVSEPRIGEKQIFDQLLQQKKEREIDSEVGCSNSLINSSKISKENKQTTAPSFLDRVKDQILREIQNTQFLDFTIKYYLYHKVFQTLSDFKESKIPALQTMNEMKFYQTYISFQKERSQYMRSFLTDNLMKSVNSTSFFQEKNITIHKPNSIEPIFNQLNPDSPSFKIKINNIDLRNHKRENSFVSKQKEKPQLPPKTKKITKKQSSDYNSQEASYNNKIRQVERLLESGNIFCDRKLRDRKKKKNKKEKYEKSHSEKYLKEVQNKDKQKSDNSKVDKESIAKEKYQADIQLSRDDEGLIQKIQGWAQRTALAYAIQQKHKKSLGKNKDYPVSEPINKLDSLKSTKKQDSNNIPKKYKDRSSKASQNEFRLMLSQKSQQLKQKQQANLPNLITFSTSANLNDLQKQQFQRQMAHLAKQLKNNDNHGKIRIGKEYYQAKMPNFIQSQQELYALIKQKREKLLQRKMSVLTF